MDQTDNNAGAIKHIVEELGSLPLVVSGSRREVFQKIRALQERSRKLAINTDATEHDVMRDAIRELEKDRDGLLTVARMALQQFEFTYGQRKKGWDAKFLMDRLRETIQEVEGTEEPEQVM